MQHVVNSVDPSSDTISVPEYVPSVNPSRYSSEQQDGALQEEIRTKLEQIKSLENIIVSGEMKVYENAQYRSYILSN